MKLSFIARSKEKGVLDISKKIIQVEAIKGSEEVLEDLQGIIQLLKKLGYSIDE